MTDITEYLTILEREIERLRAENERLLAAADDTIDPHILSERLAFAGTSKDIISTSVESIAKFIGIPYCAYLELHGEELEVIDDYSLGGQLTSKGRVLPITDEMVQRIEKSMTHIDLRQSTHCFEGIIPRALEAEIHDGYQLPVNLNDCMHGIVFVADTNKGVDAQINIEHNLSSMVEQMETRSAQVSLLNSLKESEERFSLAMRGANDGLWDWNLETDEVYFSPRWKSMLGYEEKELKNHLDTWVSLVHSDDKDWVLKKVRDYLGGRADLFKVEMRMRHKDGHEVFVLSRAFLVNRKSDDKPSRLVGTHVDITERKKSESFDEKNAEILEMIATGQPASDIYDAIALMYEGRHPGMRCSMLELHGNKLMHGGAPSLPKEYCDAVNGLENGPDVGSCGTSTYTGKRVLVENIETDPKWAAIKDAALPHGMRCCWSEPISNSSGKVLGAFGMYYNHPALPNEDELRDLQSAARLAGIIMERVHSENELDKHRQKLEELVDERTAELQEKSAQLKEALDKEQDLNELQRQFVSMASHEFRTPLAIIDIAAQRLQRQIDKNRLTPEDAVPRVEKIRASVQRIMRLMESTLVSARMDEGKLKIEIADCYIETLVNETCAHQQEIAQTHIISCDLADVPETIQADAGAVEQILTNLLSNAVKYAPHAPDIAVKAWLEGQRVAISVRDHGLGIDEAELPKIGERFFRAKTSTGIVGTGIGLNVVKELVEMHGGSIAVESRIGEGSTFTVSLPIAGPEQSAQVESRVA